MYAQLNQSSSVVCLILVVTRVEITHAYLTVEFALSTHLLDEWFSPSLSLFSRFHGGRDRTEHRADCWDPYPGLCAAAPGCGRHLLRPQQVRPAHVSLRQARDRVKGQGHRGWQGSVCVRNCRFHFFFHFLSLKKSNLCNLPITTNAGMSECQGLNGIQSFPLCFFYWIFEAESYELTKMEITVATACHTASGDHISKLTGIISQIDFKHWINVDPTCQVCTELFNCFDQSTNPVMIQQNRFLNTVYLKSTLTLIQFLLYVRIYEGWFDSIQYLLNIANLMFLGI